ncbi:hypothetical protein HDV00_012657 [Rhizophlyctis rosea]|nr:hypothetical protein HDV00_012657 [Rhizophlyctis rosea]
MLNLNTTVTHVTKTEKVHLGRLKRLVRLKKIVLTKKRDDNEKPKENLHDMVKNYLKLLDGDGTHAVDYEFKNDGEYGRLYPVGMAAPYLPSDIRKYIVGPFYIDVDMKNAVFHEYRYLGERYGIPCKEVDEYIEDREAILERKRMTKNKMASMMNCKSWTNRDKFLKALHDWAYDQLVPALKVDPEFSDLWMAIDNSEDKKDNKEGRFLAYCTQTVERKILMVMCDFFEELGWTVGSLEYDGLLLLKEVGMEITPDLLNKCENKVRAELGIKIALVEKSMEVDEEFLEKNGLTLDDSDDEGDDDMEEADEDGALQEDIPEELKKAFYNPSHLAMAEAFTFLSDGHILYDGDTFWMFRSKWSDVPKAAVRRDLKEKMNGIWRDRIEQLKDKVSHETREKVENWLNVQLKKAKDGLNFLETDSHINSIINCLQSEVYDSTFADRSDSHPFFIGCDNGYVDIRDDTFHKHSKDVIITRNVGYPYFEGEADFDPAIYEQVKTYFAQVFPVEEERQLHQQFCGYSLRGDHPEKIVMIWKDKSGGGNGKSRTGNLLNITWGTYAKVGNNQHIYKPSRQAGQNEHNASAFAYVGCRLVLFEELDDSNTLDDKKFKHENGENAEGSGRPPHGKHDVVIKYTRKWILIFNDRCEPKFDTGDEACVGRMKVMPFRAKFFKTETEMEASDHPYKHLADPNLDDKFRKWRPYVLKWAIEGHRIYEKERFHHIPDSCKEWLTEVSKSVDNLEDFIEDNVEHTGDENDIILFKDVKLRMSPTLKRRFKNDDHTIKRLCEHMKGHRKDSDGPDGKRIKNFWRGYRLRPKGEEGSRQEPTKYMSPLPVFERIEREEEVMPPVSPEKVNSSLKRKEPPSPLPNYEGYAGTATNHPQIDRGGRDPEDTPRPMESIPQEVFDEVEREMRLKYHF